MDREESMQRKNVGRDDPWADEELEFEYGQTVMRLNQLIAR